jgi:hypothetical protein
MALAAGCDGIPYHKDKNASSGWPFVITAENLPPGAYRKNQHQHMFAVAPSEELRCDENGNTYIHKRDPTSIQPILMMLSDELLTGQDFGFNMRDFSQPLSSPTHHFKLFTILLFFMGDYPGQGKVANMKHAGSRACHWCTHPFEYHSKGHSIATKTRRHLDPEDPFRQDDAFTTVEDRPQPSMRHHDETCDIAKDIDGLKGAQQEKAQKQHGVYGSCFLTLLHLFNLIWDITGDMMHLMKGTWGRRIVPMLKGELDQKRPKKPLTTYSDGNGGRTPYDAPELAAREKAFDLAKLEHSRVKAVKLFLFFIIISFFSYHIQTPSFVV